MRQEPVKAFGNVTPASPAMLAAIQAVLTSWGIEAEVELDKDICRIAFEGTYFPGDDVADALCPLLTDACVGKIDVIDMEAWTLTRYAIRNGTLTKNENGLNNVLAYSGH